MLPLVVDLRVLQSPAGSGARGMGRYALGLVRGLQAAGAPVAALTVQPGAPAPDVPGDVRAVAPVVPAGAVEVQRAAGSRYVWLATAPLDAPSYPHRVVPEFVVADAAPVAAVAYDLIPLTHPDRSFGTERDRLWYLGRLVALRSADLLLAISTFTATELVTRLGLPEEQVVAVGTGVDATFVPDVAPPDDRNRLADVLPQVPERFVLTSGFDWRKNQRLLFDAWSRLPAGLRAGRRLVVGGWVPPGFRAEWERWWDELGLDPHEVVVTGHLTDEVLASLYRTCEVFVFPSLSEGFGLPPAEAAACGAPVLASGATSIPEAVPVAEALVDPTDPAALADRIAGLLTDPARRQELGEACRRAAQHHTWEGVGRRAALALASLGARARPRPLPGAGAGDAIGALVPPHARARLNRARPAG